MESPRAQSIDLCATRVRHAPGTPWGREGAGRGTMDQSPRKAGAGAAGTLFAIWLTYGAFYFCRVNISAAVPGLQEEAHLTKAQIGTLLGALKLAYGIGQFVNGQLAERFPPRVLLALGMFGSAMLNVVFGTWTALYFLVFIWACNGYAQSLGWTPCMRVTANWFPASTRGRVIGIIGTGYQLAGACSVVLAGWAAHNLGWRAAMWLPALLLAGAGVFMLACLREAPPREEPPGEAGLPAALAAGKANVWVNVRLTLSNPSLWMLALSLCLLDAVRYGFVDWGLTHLKEVQGGRVDSNALKIAVLPLGGIAGAYLAGLASDRMFHGRRAPVIFTLLLALGVLTMLYEAASRTTLPGTIVLLVVIGFAVYGAQVLLVGTAPVDLAVGGTAAAAAGFVNFMGYMGAFAGDRVTGEMVDRYGWQTAVWVWAGCAFGAALCVAPLWGATAKGRKL